ncbi:MAG: hypothetical protein V4690_01350 [Patescibacteria group bacterium]
MILHERHHIHSRKSNNFFIHDILLIGLSVVVSIVLVKSGVIAQVLTFTKDMQLFGSFFAGMFFTSVFTTAPAIVTLGEIAQQQSVILTAVVGAAGSVVGDLIIFRFIRDRLSNHLEEVLKHQKPGKRIKMLFKLKIFRWLTFLLGGFILASPFPDEIAVSIFGFLHVKTKWFIPISFVFNFIGILLIGLIANAL